MQRFKQLADYPLRQTSTSVGKLSMMVDRVVFNSLSVMRNAWSWEPSSHVIITSFILNSEEISSWARTDSNVDTTHISECRSG